MVESIAGPTNVEVIEGAECVGVGGPGWASKGLRWRIRGSLGDAAERPPLFLVIGAEPNTDWLAGRASASTSGAKYLDRPGRAPAAPMETSAPACSRSAMPLGLDKPCIAEVGDGARSSPLAHLTGRIDRGRAHVVEQRTKPARA